MNNPVKLVWSTHFIVLRLISYSNKLWLTELNQAIGPVRAVAGKDGHRPSSHGHDGQLQLKHLLPVGRQDCHSVSRP